MIFKDKDDIQRIDLKKKHTLICRLKFKQDEWNRLKQHKLNLE